MTAEKHEIQDWLHKDRTHTRWAPPGWWDLAPTDLEEPMEAAEEVFEAKTPVQRDRLHEDWWTGFHDGYRAGVDGGGERMKDAFAMVEPIIKHEGKRNVSASIRDLLRKARDEDVIGAADAETIWQMHAGPDGQLH